MIFAMWNCEDDDNIGSVAVIPVDVPPPAKEKKTRKRKRKSLGYRNGKPSSRTAAAKRHFVRAVENNAKVPSQQELTELSKLCRDQAVEIADKDRQITELKAANHQQQQQIDYLNDQVADLKIKYARLQMNLSLLHDSKDELNQLARSLDVEEPSSSRKCKRKAFSDEQLSSRQMNRINTSLAADVSEFASKICASLGTKYGERFRFTEKGFDVTFGGFTFHHDLEAFTDMDKKRYRLPRDKCMFDDDCRLSDAEILAAADEEKKVNLTLLNHQRQHFAKFKDDLSISYTKLQTIINHVYDMTGKKLPSVDRTRDVNCKLNAENSVHFDVEPLTSIAGAQLSLRKSLCYVAGHHARNHQLPISASRSLY
jgi:uncharacterized coiled-coil protein SlyX